MLAPMQELTDWRLAFAPGGWVRASRPADSTTVYMRLRGSGTGPQQRLNVHTVLMDSAAPVSTHVWRDVPFRDVEEIANNTGGLLGGVSQWNPVRDNLRAPAARELLDLPALEEHFGTSDQLVSLDSEHPTLENHMVILQGDRPDPGTKPPALVRPDGRITDDFLRQLAATYRWLVASGESAPAASIAQQTGAPVATVRRWIVNARQREFLPPGRPGRAG